MVATKSVSSSMVSSGWRSGAMLAWLEKISWMFPLSHLLPSDTKISSADTSTPRALKSCSTIASRRKS